MREALEFPEPAKDRRSPLEILNDKIQAMVPHYNSKLVSTDGILSQRPRRDADDKMARLLRGLFERMETYEDRSFATFAGLERSVAATDGKVTEALRAISACIDAIEKTPRISLNIIRTLTTRLDQIEERLPEQSREDIEALRAVIMGLDDRLDHLLGVVRSDGEAVSQNSAQIATINERMECLLATLNQPSAEFEAFSADMAAARSASEALTGFQQRFDALEQGQRHLAEAMQARAGAGTGDDQAAALAAINGQVASLSADVATWRTGAFKAAMADLRRDMVHIATRLEGSATAAALNALSGRVDALISQSNAAAMPDSVAAGFDALGKSLADLSDFVRSRKPVSLEPAEAHLRSILARLDRPQPAAIDPAALDGRLEALHALVSAQQGPVDAIRTWVEGGGTGATDLTGVMEGLAALRADLAARDSEKPAADATAGSAVQAELSTVHAVVVDVARQIEVLQGRVGHLEVAATTLPDLAKGVAGLGTDLASIQQHVSAPPDNSALATIAVRVGALHGMLGENNGKTEALREQLLARDAGLKETVASASEMAALREQVAALDRHLKAPKVPSPDKTLHALSARLDMANEEIRGLREMVMAQAAGIDELLRRLPREAGATMAQPECDVAADPSLVPETEQNDLLPPRASENAFKQASENEALFSSLETVEINHSSTLGRIRLRS